MSLPLIVTAETNPLVIPPDELPEFCNLTWSAKPMAFHTESDKEMVTLMASFWYGKSPPIDIATLQLMVSNVYTFEGENPDKQAVVLTFWQFLSEDAAIKAIEQLNMRKFRNVRFIRDLDQVVILSYKSSVNVECHNWLWLQIENGIENQSKGSE